MTALKDLFNTLDFTAITIINQKGLTDNDFSETIVDSTGWFEAFNYVANSTSTWRYELLESDSNAPFTDIIYSKVRALPPSNRDDYAVLNSGETRSKFLAACMLYNRMKTLCKREPVFQHDCTQCQYLGCMPLANNGPRGKGNVNNLVDLYACSAHQREYVFARFGEEIDEFSAAEIHDDTKAPHDPHLREALRRRNQ